MSRKQRYSTLRIDKQRVNADVRNALQMCIHRYVTIRLAGMYRVQVGNGHIWPTARTEIFYWHPAGGFVLRTKSEVYEGRVQMIATPKKTISSFAEFMQFAAYTYANGLDVIDSRNIIVNLKALNKQTERELDGEIEYYYDFEVDCSQYMDDLRARSQGSEDLTEDDLPF